SHPDSYLGKYGLVAYGSSVLTLHETRQHLTPCLQQRVPHHNLQKPLQPLPSVLNHIVTESIREHLPWQRRDRDARRLPLEDVAEMFEIGVAPADGGVLQLLD